MASEEDEWRALPLPEQFAHKNWKARKQGYEIAAKEFKIAPPGAPIVREFIFESSLWKGAVSDSNVAAQQEALSAYNAFLDAAGTEGARKTRGSTIGGIVEKGLIGRPAAKSASIEALLLLIELDKSDPIIEELLPYLSHKLPKIIVAALGALKDIYHAYGCKIVEPKPVVKLLPKIFGHADKNVRAEGQALTVELYRWLREAMKPLFWGELKEVQQKDLEKLFEPVKAESAPKQERLLRSQQAAQEAAEEAGVGGEADGGDDDDGGAEIDLEPEYVAVDVFAKVPKDFNERLGSTKWKDRKEALDETFAAVNVPAIQEGPFDDIMRGCAKSMKDANIAVVQVAANVVECIAKGLRKGFGRYRSTILGAMLERFKEKKQAVTDAIGAACDAIFASTGLSDVQVDVLEALKSKNPQVKEHTAKFLIRGLKSTREVPSAEQTKEVSEAAKKLLTESSAPLRDAGAEILGVLWKIMGDRNMLSHLEGLDEIRKTKIKEFSDAAEVKAKWKPKAAPPPKAAAPPAKKPALGAKRAGPPGAAKKPAPARATSPPIQMMEDAPLQPRPTSKTPAKGPAGLRAPGAGLKGPSGLAKPTAMLKAPSVVTSATASPKRQGVVIDDPPIPMTPRAAPGRGLAGRPIARPAQPPSPTPAPPPHDHSAGLREIDRQEILSLQQENAMLRDQLSGVRSDKARYASQIAELQVQNAQLIEDHTRDVLQIKAKETQLVRARSDAENAMERASSLAKEIERLKREMSRLNRDGSGAMGRDSPVDNGAGSRASAYLNGRGGAGYERPSSRSSRPLSNGTSSPDPDLGPASPAARPMSMYSGVNGGSSNLARSSSDAGNSAGVESWKRAAEVTQNLKARIEMMKARQNLGRGQ